MERTYYDNYGQLILEWTDKNGNIWNAVKEQVDILGKECFEQDPTDYVDSFSEHPEVKALRKAEQVLKEYFEMSLKPFDDDILPF